MKPLKPWVLVLVAIVVGLLGVAANAFAMRSSAPTPVLPISAIGSMAVIAVVTLGLGIRVLRWRTGHRSHMLDPIFAARTLVLAHACAYAGAVLLGWHGGVIADQVPLLASRAGTPAVETALLLIAGSVVMVAIGFIVERFCRIPPEEGDDDGLSEGGRTPDTEGGLA
ncbi:membrane protein [Sinomonas atrocyanea]|uniref:Membrane protein n=1 Tax=Sinomonas atrocyanea TaxID=37927 RepID=A0A126ZVK0_9MICC|nr:DUF3180 domain-containing protein [Sinomonas atrocyanea]AMM30977.1 membrane protein [Sinomonas atrocyanea]GEB63217.1 hypothetical protein SAT01_06650 [Sinomonas atrocyanea]GGG77211.1 hypothetical protein GCM10007172_32720 [Sinomonas atrocyanea]